MSTSDSSEREERTSELLLAIAAVRDMRFERAQTDEERAKVIADYEAVRQTMQAVLKQMHEENRDSSHR